MYHNNENLTIIKELSNNYMWKWLFYKRNKNFSKLQRAKHYLLIILLLPEDKCADV